MRENREVIVCYPGPPSDQFLKDLRAAMPAGWHLRKELTPDCEVLIEGRLEEATLSLARDLKHVVVPFAGVPEATLQAVRLHPNIRLHNLHHNAIETGEHALALMFAAAKRVAHQDILLRSNNWSPRYVDAESVLLRGKQVVLLGYGAIGMVIAPVCQALGMRVTVISRKEKECDGMSWRPVAEMDQVLPSAQFLLVCLPLTQETKGLLSAERISLLPRDAILVNIARAQIVDEEALFTALKDKKIRGAGLDVWWQYPASAGGVPGYFHLPESALNTAPSRFPFAELDNVVMTPHRGGTVEDTERRRLEHLAALLQALSRGEETNLVNLDSGY